MTDESYKILDGLSLVEVLRANGHEPARMPRRGRAKYHCPLPGHQDTEPSFQVDREITAGADKLGWKCWGKCGRQGYGAVSLQAALMGYDHTALTNEQRAKVLQRLIDDHDVEIEGAKPTTPEQRSEPIAPQECDPSDLAPWTATHLRTLGFTVKAVTQTEGDGEVVTQYREGTGEPLYRCSIDREYWRGRGAEHTVQEWGDVLEREFSVHPVETFITGPIDAPQGGKFSLKIHARPTYPIFVFAYDWGIKKYEPKGRKYKWYWSARGVETKVYGDSVAVRAIEQAALGGKKDTDPTPAPPLDGRGAAAAVGGDASERHDSDRPWYADVIKDRRHPLLKLTGMDSEKKPYTYYKMKRLVLCSGPRDAMQMWAATDAHVLWLHNEMAGLRDGVVEEWLRVLLIRMQQVAVDVFVCYDLDQTGVTSSASIALENANVHWVRLPKEMTEIETQQTHPRPLPAREGSGYSASDNTNHNNTNSNDRSNKRQDIGEGSVSDNADGQRRDATHDSSAMDGAERPSGAGTDSNGAANGAANGAVNGGVVTTPLHRREGRGVGLKHLKDVTDFVTHFKQIQARFAPDLRKANPSDALMRLLKNALTMQFWIDKPTTKKDRDGERERNIRYVLSVANLLQFLDAKGIRCHSDERGQRAFYLLSHNNTYHYLDTARTGNQLESAARTAMLDWLDAHFGDEDDRFKANLVNTIFTGKGLDQRTMNTMPAQPLNEHSWGEDFDTFFFENTAVQVTRDGIREVAYDRLPWVTNEECILPGEFRTVSQPWRIVINPKYEAKRRQHEEIARQCTTPEMRAAENTRWLQYEQLWKYRLVMDRPLAEMPLHFRFLYNLGRIFWEKESFGETLTLDERQMQDMHFINKVHAIGYAITRHRSRARQQIVHMTDYAVSDERKASGRNGKSAVIDMLGAVRPSSANVAGKSINGSNMTLSLLLGDVVAGVHSVVGIDELPDGFKAEELYNAPVTLVCKTLYRQPITLRGEDVPKLFIASNKPFDRSSGSTKGRIYPCFTSDYYHAATDDGRWLDFAPKDEFMAEYGVQEVANGLPPRLLNELRNLLLACAQFFFQQPTDTILPPTESRSLRRELYAMSKDSGLTDWLIAYFEDVPFNPHIGQPIAPQEMAISLLDSEGESVTNESIEKAKKRITKYLKPCLNRMGIVMDPPVVLDTASYRRHGGRQARAWLTVLDAQGRPVEQTVTNKHRHVVSTGERVPRELSQHTFVHYYYRNRPGGIPTNPYTKGHEYDEGYVQAAAEKDPEAAEMKSEE